MSYPNSFKNTIIPNPTSLINDETYSSHRSGNHMYCEFVSERVPEIENTDEKGWKSILARLLLNVSSFKKYTDQDNLVPLNRKKTASQQTHVEGEELTVVKTRGGGGNIRRRRHRKRTAIIRKNKKTRLSYINKKTRKRRSNK
jgi:hypothetical protein